MAWDDESEDTTVYRVIVNSGQYSLLPVGEQAPEGWSDEGKTGTKQECLEYIDRLWTDMRPASLRQKMDQEQQQEAGKNTGNG